jgi:hypothetical protein
VLVVLCSYKVSTREVKVDRALYTIWGAVATINRKNISGGSNIKRDPEFSHSMYTLAGRADTAKAGGRKVCRTWEMIKSGLHK